MFTGFLLWHNRFCIRKAAGLPLCCRANDLSFSQSLAEEGLMKRSLMLLLIVVVTLAQGISAEAQQAKKIPRIGFMIGTSPSIIPDRIEGLRQGLRELGYVEGKNVVIEY